MSAVADHVWATLTVARRVLEDARCAEAEAVERRRVAERDVECAETIWRQVLADGREAARP
jgi:hypothetical protein